MPSKSEAPTKSGYYALDDNDLNLEVARLNSQYLHFKTVFGSNTVPPVVNINHVGKVIDVATGTGAWALDFVSQPNVRDRDVQKPPPLDGQEPDIAAYTQGKSTFATINRILSGWALQQGFDIGLSYHFQKMLQDASLQVLSSTRALAPHGEYCLSHKGPNETSLSEFTVSSSQSLSHILDSVTLAMMKTGCLELGDGIRIADEEERKALMRERLPLPCATSYLLHLSWRQDEGGSSTSIILVLDAHNPARCRSRSVEEDGRGREAEGKRFVFALNKIGTCLPSPSLSQAWCRARMHMPDLTGARPLRALLHLIVVTKSSGMQAVALSAGIRLHSVPAGSEGRLDQIV
ncbi:hypothetical protein EDB86DRAFT_3081541 [Lactarius hatsudake]|nr:hypothetical protein EDB86DRAFT_3081541 [Lactarius hatsudake]